MNKNKVTLSQLANMIQKVNDNLEAFKQETISRLDRLETRVENLEKRMDKLETKVESIEKDVSVLKSEAKKTWMKCLNWFY